MELRLRFPRIGPSDFLTGYLYKFAAGWRGSYIVHPLAVVGHVVRRTGVRNSEFIIWASICHATSRRTYILGLCITRSR